jgi:hypothetical protein
MKYFHPVGSNGYDFATAYVGEDMRIPAFSWNGKTIISNKLN